MWRTLFLLIPLAAHAQDASLRYAILPDLASAQALSAGAWSAVKCSPQPACDKAQVTQFNYPVIVLKDGTYAVVLHSGDPKQGEHIITNGKTFDLTAQQIAGLKTAPDVSKLLPDPVVPGDVALDAKVDVKD